MQNISFFPGNIPAGHKGYLLLVNYEYVIHIKLRVYLLFDFSI